MSAASSNADAPIRYLAGLPRAADLVIVGGGIVGAATAFHAARAGFDPVVLERRPALCTLTTAVAAGGFRLQLDDREEFDLVRESVDLFLDFAEATGQRTYDPAVRQQGYLWLTTGDEGAERQRRLVQAQRSWGIDDVDLVTGDEARRRFPFLGPDVVQARFRRADGLIDPKAVTFGLAAASGAQVVTGCEVLGFTTTTEGDRLTGVVTTGGTVNTGVAVVAAGPFSGIVAAMAGVDLPLTAVRRQKLVMPEVAQVPPGAPMTIDDDTGAHWRPWLGGASVLFTDPTTPTSPPADDVPLDHGFVFQVLDPKSPSSVARVTPFWCQVWERGSDHWMLQAGQYTMTPDRRPLIGETAVEGLFVNTGYCGHGVMASPAGSRHLVDVITGKVERDANPYRPDRGFDDRSLGSLL